MKIYQNLSRSTPLRPNRILLLITRVQSLTFPVDFEPYWSASRLGRILAANIGANNKAAERTTCVGTKPSIDAINMEGL
ncbi:hypothetical protein AHAS_Ahas15G0233000 [Arachis hypogaea]